MKKACLLLLSLVFANVSLFSQEEDPKDIFLDGEYFIMYEEYTDALPFYQQLYEKDPENTNVCYRIGVCYINLPGMKDKAIPYLEKAIQNTTENYQEGSYAEKRAPLDAYYFLGTAYRINNQLDKAASTYRLYRDKIDPRDTINMKFIEQEIAACSRAMEMKQHPVAIEKENLGNMINDNYKNFNPLVSADEKSLIFMSGLKFYDAIFWSKKVAGRWTVPINLTPQVRSDGDLYPTGLSEKGDLLFLAKNMDVNSDIYESTLEGSEWTPAKELNKNINTKYWESHACITTDGKSLYFVSNKPGGHGGFDIYRSDWNEKEKDWGKAVNIGSTINTCFNEETPFITEDGKYLFFSSQGHENMGGYDIFYSTLGDNNQWSKPVNLGYPINTTDDDLFFFPSKDGIYGYEALFTSDGFGNDDIYKIEIFSDRNPRNVSIKGVVSLKDKTDLSGQSLTIKILNDQGAILTTLVPNPSNGTAQYTSKIPGKYSMIFSGQGYTSATRDFELPVDYSLAEVVVNAMLEPVMKEFIILKAVYFDFDKNDIRPSEAAKLDGLAQVMNANSDLIVEAIGHADSKGSDKYNLKLSEKRSMAVAGYLTGKGVSGDRIKIKAMGESTPLAINQNPDGTDNPEGRKWNRRVEIHIISSQNPLIKSETIIVPEELKIK